MLPPSEMSGGGKELRRYFLNLMLQLRIVAQINNLGSKGWKKLLVVSPSVPDKGDGSCYYHQQVNDQNKSPWFAFACQNFISGTPWCSRMGGPGST